MSAVFDVVNEQGKLWYYINGDLFRTDENKQIDEESRELSMIEYYKNGFIYKTIVSIRNTDTDEILQKLICENSNTKATLYSITNTNKRLIIYTANVPVDSGDILDFALNLITTTTHETVYDENGGYFYGLKETFYMFEDHENDKIGTTNGIYNKGYMLSKVYTDIDYYDGDISNRERNIATYSYTNGVEVSKYFDHFIGNDRYKHVSVNSVSGEYYVEEIFNKDPSLFYRTYFDKNDFPTHTIHNGVITYFVSNTKGKVLYKTHNKPMVYIVPTFMEKVKSFINKLFNRSNE